MRWIEEQCNLSLCYSQINFRDFQMLNSYIVWDSLDLKNPSNAELFLLRNNFKFCTEHWLIPIILLVSYRLEEYCILLLKICKKHQNAVKTIFYRHVVNLHLKISTLRLFRFTIIWKLPSSYVRSANYTKTFKTYTRVHLTTCNNSVSCY